MIAVLHIVVCRKPLEGTVVENVQRYGVGGLNIDGCRVVTSQEDIDTQRKRTGGVFGGDCTTETVYSGGWKRNPAGNSQGRWPANLITDGSDEVVGRFPQSSNGRFPSRLSGNSMFGLNGHTQQENNLGDSGSASRFFKRIVT